MAQEAGKNTVSDGCAKNADGKIAHKAHLMFDLETIGIQPTSGILEIGWCTFSDEAVEVSPAKDLIIPLSQNMLYGFDYDADTIKWWLEKQQYKNLETKLFHRPHVTFPQVLSELASQWNELWFDGVQTLWAKGTDFDVRILKHAYDKLGIERPIILREENFSKQRDARTLFKVCDSYILFVPSMPYVAHQAKLDAHTQAYNIALCFERLRKLQKDSESFTEMQRVAPHVHAHIDRLEKQVVSLTQKLANAKRKRTSR